MSTPGLFRKAGAVSRLKSLKVRLSTAQGVRVHVHVCMLIWCVHAHVCMSLVPCVLGGVERCLIEFSLYVYQKNRRNDESCLGLKGQAR